MKFKYIVNKNYESINQILVSELDLSTRLMNKLIKNKKIYLNDNIVDTRIAPSIGDTIAIDLNYEEDNSNIIPKHISLNIIYEDEWILVIDKPSGIAVHPSILHFDDSLSNGVRYYFDKIRFKEKNKACKQVGFKHFWNYYFC